LGRAAAIEPNRVRPNFLGNLIPMIDTTIQVNQLANLFGVTTRTISDLARRGIVVRKAKGVARDESIRRYVTHLREAAAGRGQAAPKTVQTTERGRLAKNQADLLQIKIDTAKGKLLDSDEVKVEWARILRLVRNGVLAAPARIASRRPHFDARDIAAIDDELREVLTQLGKSADDT
jgi:phage terminase Nu1 subunit (DNA packaging protein)